MKQLRQLIRQIILEGPVKDEFDEAWFNTDTERDTYKSSQSEEGTFHSDQLLNKGGFGYTQKKVNQLFKDKRDLKRLWNDTIDTNNLRSFWEGPKMKYFHSLSYYSAGPSTQGSLIKGAKSDDDLVDLSVGGFLQQYKKTDNKDEMSTWGYYVPLEMIGCSVNQMAVGVILKGRVTLATKDDAWTESRSKASDRDYSRHKSSGMPKRIMPTNSNVESLLFEEEDILEHMRIGECILDNWGIEAIVYNHRSPYIRDPQRWKLEKLSKEYGIPLVTATDIFF